MNIGLLLCDQVPADLRQAHGDYLTMFQRYLPEVTFQPYDVYAGVFPDNVHVHHAYIINGSRYSVYDDLQWIHQLKDWLRVLWQTGKKCVGLCFGHQLIAEALGGSVAKASVGWCVGVHCFNIQAETVWMQPTMANMRLLMMCQDQVQALPPGGRLVARAADCPIGMYTIGEQMLGIQGHPEFSKAYDRSLMEQRVDRIGTEKTAAGIESLTQDVDADVMSSWIMHFLSTGI